MNNLIERITEAIFRQEGESPTHKNPGNLRFAPWIDNPHLVNGFWEPFTRAQGVAGAAHVVALKIAQGFSLRKLITDPARGWAPAADHNNSEVYLKNVAEWAEIPNVDVPLWIYLELPT